MSADDVFTAQLTRDLFSIAKFLVFKSIGNISNEGLIIIPMSMFMVLPLQEFARFI